MTPATYLARRACPIELVIFDCDGVIVDTEGIASRITATAISSLGWSITPAEAEQLFLGMTLDDMMPVIEAKIGRSIPLPWRDQMMQDFLEELGRSVTAIDGAVEVLQALDDAGLAWRIASNSSHAEMQIKFARLGMSERVAGRLHSHQDVSRGKPAPDVFFAAATASDVLPQGCLVIEDSVIGASAAAAAGMDCLGYAPHDGGDRLRRVGAVPFKSMYELPNLLGLEIVK